MSKAKLITVGVLAAVVLIVLFQNRQSVDTHFLFVTVTMPRAILLGTTAVLGFAGGVVVSLSYFRKP